MQQKNALGGKLIMACVSLTAAFVLLVVGTFAWFTTGTEAEISNISVSFLNDGSQWPFEVSTDGTNWDKNASVPLTSALKDGILRPISTADLEHWYLPTYDAFGSVNDFREVRLSEVANREPDADHAAEQIYNDETYFGNYLVYGDIWVRVPESGASYKLMLNNPKTENGQLHLNPEELTDETGFGTYVLWTPDLSPTATGYAANDAMSVIRVGFQLLDADGAPTGTPTILEPNADLHGSLSDSATAAQYNASGDVKYLGGDTRTVTRSSVSGVQTTKVPKYTGTGTYSMQTQQTIKQKTSAWDAAKLAALQSITDLNSTCVGTIGAIDENTNTPIATVTNGTEQRIRIYFWLEGQDVDCWNQIAGGSIYANLEFRGDPVT